MVIFFSTVPLKLRERCPKYYRYYATLSTLVKVNKHSLMFIVDRVLHIRNGPTVRIGMITHTQPDTYGHPDGYHPSYSMVAVLVS